MKLETLDDSYEPDYSSHATEWFIEKERVFALIGAVGTPTSRVAVPLAHEAGVPFLAPFTGAELLRDPALNNVINVRASYHQETEKLALRLNEHLGLTRVGVLYQDVPTVKMDWKGFAWRWDGAGWSRSDRGITSGILTWQESWTLRIYAA